MKTTKRNYLQYISDSFDLEALGLPETSTPRERATAFLLYIEGRHSPRRQDNVMQHLQGVGEGIDIEYMNYSILEQAKEFGLINQMMNNAKYSKYKDKKLALEKVQEQIIENYWNVMACYIIQLSEHNYIFNQ